MFQTYDREMLTRSNEELVHHRHRDAPALAPMPVSVFKIPE